MVLRYSKVQGHGWVSPHILRPSGYETPFPLNSCIHLVIKNALSLAAYMKSDYFDCPQKEYR